MTPEQKIKHLIIVESCSEYAEHPSKITSTNIDDIYEDLYEEGELWDALYDLREGEFETGLSCPTSRHYESRAVASQTPDGSWVGWTYWYGGGKHAEPASIPWMEEAYDLECTEEEKTVVVRTFKKRGRS